MEADQPSDALELELRQLAGVSFVGFGSRDGSALIEVIVAPGSDRRRIEGEVRRLAVGHLDGEPVIEVADSPHTRPETDPGDGVGAEAEARVQLVSAVPSAGAPEVEIHLAHGGRRTVVVAPVGDLVAAAEAAIEGLGHLGFDVPFAVLTAEPVGVGDETLVVLRHAPDGELRRGLVGGPPREESSVRAVLNALNRYLQPVQRPPGRP